VLALLVFVVVVLVIGLGYLALILGRSIRLHVSLRSFKVEIDKPEVPPADSKQ
jgi:hypothetical protein